MTTNTGGPAFPLPNHTKRWNKEKEYFEQDEGMTLRDYFAAKAMQAIMGADRYGGVIGVNNYQHRTAIDAYAMADAMLKARET